MITNNYGMSQGGLVEEQINLRIKYYDKMSTGLLFHRCFVSVIRRIIPRCVRSLSRWLLSNPNDTKTCHS